MALYIFCGVSIDIVIIYDRDAIAEIIIYIYIIISLLPSLSYTKPLPSERT